MLNWVSNDGKTLPKKSGQYLIATFDGDNWIYDVGDFYKKGESIILGTPTDKLPEEVKNLSADEKLLWVVMKDNIVCPKDGFYCTEEGECWEIVNYLYWAKIPEPGVGVGLCG